LELRLEPGLVLVVGPNGAGKTNLLESLHVGTQGFSPRTRSDAHLIRFEAPAARIAVRGTRTGGVPVDVEVTLRRGGGKQGSLNGARLRAAEQLRGEVATLVFTPDRLAVVKAAPAVRRAYLDRSLGRLHPARAGLPASYAAGVGQRNAALRRVSLGLSSREALQPWTARVVSLGAELVAARRETLGLLEPAFRRRAAELGLADAELAYLGEPPTGEALEARLERDVERGVTGLGPHLDDVLVSAAGRDLRLYGSQGEQRLAVLSLLLAEADVLVERRGEAPLLLLDDVLSELDEDRRLTLLGGLPAGAQAIVTATSEMLAPVVPGQVVEVAPGRARVR
jgi:DNA replication and repair protein RecF